MFRNKLNTNCLFFRLSIEKGIFNLLKIVKVFPVFKSNDDFYVSNYRPISVLPVFSKVLERIMHNRVFDYSHKNKLFFKGDLRPK